MKLLLAPLAPLLLAGCAVFGVSGVENAPYSLIQTDQKQKIEVRNYDSIILVSSDMAAGGSNSAFRNLFRYITGENDGGRDIAMTAPVLMNESEADRQGTKIAMTAPVFMGEQSNQRVMSFVMPADFTMDNTPKPTNPNVWISEVTDYKVVAIRFSGRLSNRNAAKHTQRLNRWLQDNGYTAINAPMSAAYNGPFTIPWFRRNEVLIEVI